MTNFTTRAKKIISYALAAAFWILVWQLAYSRVSQDIILASPAQTAQRLLSLCTQAEFWRSVGFTVLRVLAGFSAAVVFATVLAALTAGFNAANILFSPLLSVVRATPVASFIIIALVWMNRDAVPIFIAFLMVVPVVWANVFAGIKATDTRLLEMAKLFRFSPLRKLRLVYVPSVIPHFVGACSSGLGFAWKSAIAAEVLSLPRKSVGVELYSAKIYLETADLFAWTAAVIILSIILEKIIMRLIASAGARLGGGAHGAAAD